MKTKQKFKLKCKCGKEIIGFSQKHAEQNLNLHKLISKEHKERMELIKNFSESLIITKNMSINEIVEILANHPIIIDDIKAIGSNKEEKYEKEIMVS